MATKARLLVVDDDIGIRESVKYIFAEDDSIEFATVENADQAIAYFKENEVDVLMVDFEMPGMNGLELIDVLRRSYPNTVRILLSGKVGLEEVREAFNRGLISQFILKPWQDDEELTSAVQVALRSRRVIEQSQMLMRQYQELKNQMDKLGRAVLATCLAIRHDSAVAQDAEFLRRTVSKGDSNE